MLFESNLPCDEFTKALSLSTSSALSLPLLWSWAHRPRISPWYYATWSLLLAAEVEVWSWSYSATSTSPSWSAYVAAFNSSLQFRSLTLTPFMVLSTPFITLNRSWSMVMSTQATNLTRRHWWTYSLIPTLGYSSKWCRLSSKMSTHPICSMQMERSRIVLKMNITSSS